MIKFIDLFSVLKKNLSNYKVHLATGIETDPLNAFLQNDFKEWQEWQNRRNFEREYIISLIHLERDKWLFAGIYKKNNCKKVNKPYEHYEYVTEQMDINKDLIGRLIINFKRTRASYRRLENCIEGFTISHILEEKYSIIEFPGYEKVIVDFEYLKTIIEKNDKSWYTALRNIKGVYLITDKKNGKLYVGSAYGTDAIWSRWKDYIYSGHGGNIELKKLLKKRGVDYRNNFQFSILEIRATTTADSEIIEREQHWKNVLLTKEFGYNKN